MKQAVELGPNLSDAMAGISYILVNGNDPTQMAESLRWARTAIASIPESAKAQ